jgi:hypothetical protein
MAKKDLQNPPSYLKDLKQLLKIDGLINDEEMEPTASNIESVRKGIDNTQSMSNSVNLSVNEEEYTSKVSEED